jgi:hypothetical protein
MTSRDAIKIRVVTLNCRDDGWVSRLGRHDVDSVVTAVETLGPAPDILCLPSMAGLGLDSSATLQALTEGLNELLDDGQDCFYPVWSDRARSRNPFGLWLRIPRVHARADPPMPCHPQAVSVTVAGVRGRTVASRTLMASCPAAGRAGGPPVDGARAAPG